MSEQEERIWRLEVMEDHKRLEAALKEILRLDARKDLHDAWTIARRALEQKE